MITLAFAAFGIAVGAFSIVIGHEDAPLGVLAVFAGLCAILITIGERFAS